LASSGLLYGTTGPIFGLGNRFSAFQITPSGQRTTLAFFNGSLAPRLVEQSSDGTFYGLREDGGLSGAGSIIRVTPAGLEIAVASFDWRQTGGRPESLFLAKDGNRYGFTSYGGPTDSGTIFKLSPEGLLTTLFPLPDQAGGFSLSNATPSSLIESDEGKLYFTAYITNQPNLFQITPQGDLTPLAEIGLYAQLIGSTNGLLFGLNNPVDSTRVPTIFTLRSTTLATIFAYPRTNTWLSNLLLARDGHLYGTVFERGGLSPAFFRLTPSGVFTRLATSEIFGQLLYRTLFEGSDGYFYGTTLLQDNTVAKVLRIAPDGTFSVLTSISPGQPFDGPHFIQGRDGILYGFLQVDSLGDTSFFRLVPSPNINVRLLPSGEINLTWNSFTGGVYRIDYKSTLSDFDWTPLTPDVTARNEFTSIADNPRGASQRYYRVRLLP
jgi:uncharacterized repeat protein (TIGR03803 family)